MAKRMLITRMCMLLVVLLLMLNLVSAQSSQKVYDLLIDFLKDDRVQLKKINIIEGQPNILPKEDGDYSIKILSDKEKELFSTKFDLAFQVHRDVIDEKGQFQQVTINLSKVEHYFRLPYYTNAKRIEIMHLDVLIFSKRLEFCNSNNLCEPKEFENVISCPNDCPSGSNDNYCDKILDGICDPNCAEEMDIDCTCGNKVCNVRENERTCPFDCKLSLWQRILLFLKSLIGVNKI